MRHQGDSTAGPPASRARDLGARDTRGRRGQSGGGTGGQAVTSTDSEQSVFVPGYRSGRPGREPGHQAAGPGTPGSPWYGPSADGPVGKGPVRGFPPNPGQPPPLYPPGQFAAWNRLSATATDTDTDAGSPAAEASWSAGLGADGSTGQRGPASYADTGPGGQPYEPGYSALAVSDPAADVTSTQTWEVIPDAPDGPDGPGAWTNPHGTAVDAQGTAVQRPPAGLASGDGRGAGPAADTPPGRSPRAHGARSARSRGAGSHGTAPTVPEPRSGEAGADAPGGSEPAGAGSRATARDTSLRPGAAAGSRAAGSRSARSGGKRKGRRSPSVALAVGAVLILAVAAGVFLLNTARNQGSKSAAPSTRPTTAPAATPTPTPTPSLGPFGHIASRKADPLPVTITQLFPHTFTSGTVSFARTISQRGKSCTAVIVGTSLQAAVKAGKCTQVVRASYLSAARKEMGTIGVLNLTSATKAEHAGRAAGPSDFIQQLRAHKGPTHLLGKGSGIEEAATKGHYLILIWVQFTNRHKPKTAGQRKELVDFMNHLFLQTANVSLSNRMVDGAP
jgi:hypothetical protein